MSGCKEREKLAERCGHTIAEWSHAIESLARIEARSAQYTGTLKRIKRAEEAALAAKKSYLEHLEEHRCK